MIEQQTDDRDNPVDFRQKGFRKEGDPHRFSVVMFGLMITTPDCYDSGAAGSGLRVNGFKPEARNCWYSIAVYSAS